MDKFYAEVQHDLLTPQLASHIHQMWPAVVDWNRKLFAGLAQFHAAAEHADDYAYGSQVRQALAHLAATPTRPPP